MAINKKELKRFGFILTTSLSIISLILFAKSGHQHVWILVFAAIVFSAALIKAELLRPFHLILNKIGHLIGKINATVVLGLFFYTILTPISFILKLLGKDSLNRKLKTIDTYWIKRDKNLSDPRRMERQF